MSRVLVSLASAGAEALASTREGDVMNAAHTVPDGLNLLMLGALLGAAGQVVRQIAGLKKLLDENPGGASSRCCWMSRASFHPVDGGLCGNGFH